MTTTDLDSPALTWLIVVNFLSVETFGNFFILAIIWYETQVNVHQTLIDRLAMDLVGYTMICVNFVVLPLHVLRILIGPLPSEVCTFYATEATGFVIIFLLTFNEIFVFLFLYLMIWKNVGALNDDLVHLIIRVCNLGMTLFLVVIVMMSESYKTVHFYFCIQAVPSAPEERQVTLPIPNVLGIITALLCFILNSVLCFKTNRDHDSDLPYSHKLLHFSFPFMIVIIFNAISIFFFSRLDYSTDAEANGNVLLVAIVSYNLNMTLAGLIMPLGFVMINRKLKKALWRELKDVIGHCRSNAVSPHA